MKVNSLNWVPHISVRKKRQNEVPKEGGWQETTLCLSLVCNRKAPGDQSRQLCSWESAGNAEPCECVEVFAAALQTRPPSTDCLGTKTLRSFLHEYGDGRVCP
jgi:hypothetical protein